MGKLVDRWLNKVTMYRLVLYYLIALLVIALAFSIVGILPYDPFSLLLNVGFLIAASWIVNTIFARVFKVPANVESVYISALILALIIDPVQSPNGLWFLGWAAVWAMASKYIVAINRKHLFNPVTFAVALTAITLNQNASWWIGTASMLPFVLIGGMLLVRKIQRRDLVVSFLISALATITVLSIFNGNDLLSSLGRTFSVSPLFFFAFVILTEPLTTPPTRPLQIIYGALVGFLFAPDVHFGSLYITPEIAMLVGNVFSYLVSPKSRLILTLKEKIRISPDIYDFIFVPNQRLAFAPGQYMEWTLGHDAPDNRGNRRYFTLASSPTENEIRLGVKFYPNSSSYKQSMLNMDRHTEIFAAQLAGDFTLPKDPRQKCVFIAGGIGITPFRSMIQYLLDTHQQRDIVVLYSNKTADEIVYWELLNRAERELGIRTIYTLTDTRHIPADWKWHVGRVDAKMIRANVLAYRDRVFYISGPNAMVTEVQSELTQHLRIRQNHIKIDFFPGLA